MKKFILLVSLMAVFTWGFSSNVVPVETAKRASKNFLAERVGAMDAKNMDITLAYTEYDADGTPLYYRFQIGEQGFMIVSATDLATPVLAYSLESNFKKGTGADFYCEKYKRDLAYLVKNPSTALKSSKLWNRYTDANFSLRASSSKANPCVEPLVTTTWTQETYYNTQCPMNPETDLDWDLRTPVGCVALTMANIMYYYRYPYNGYGSLYYRPIEYDDETQEPIYTYPAQYANFQNGNYTYNCMSNSLDNYNGEMAKLIYHCGVSVRMGYGHDGSGSQSEDALTSLQNNFYYAQSAQFQEKKEVVFADTLLYLWVNKAKAELDARRPLFYSGRSESAGGHAWIVDGYTTVSDDEGNENTYFHVNWGWAGTDNGFFLINDQNTHGSGNFNGLDGEGKYTESMMTGLMPGDSAAVAKPALSEERVTAASGTISDGAGHVKYAPGSNRTWMIACPNATKYQFQFSKLKVKAGDKVTIYNGPTVGSGVKQEYSGNYLMPACAQYSNLGVYGDYEGQTLPGSVSVTADSVLVVFSSAENSETDYGFVLDFKATAFATSNNCSSNTQVINNSWNGVLTDKANNATGSDDTYNPGTVCNWRIQVPYTEGYVLCFHKFDLKAGEFVDVYDYTTPSHPTLIARFDNNNLPNGAFTVPAAKAFVRFAADNWQEGTGFELEYYQIAGVEQNESFSDVNVYPNPASTNLNVAIATNDAQVITANVMDMTGKLIYSEQLSHNGGDQVFTIPVNNMSKGIYMLHLVGDKGKSIQKFIVQ